MIDKDDLETAVFGEADKTNRQLAELCDTPDPTPAPEAALREKLHGETIADKCESCSYNTGDYVCHPHCSGCNGRSKFESR